MIGNKLDIVMSKTKNFLKVLKAPISVEIVIGGGYRCEVFYSKILSHVYLIGIDGVCKRLIIREGKEMESRKTSAKNLKELCRVLDDFGIVKYNFLTVFNDYSIEFRSGGCENGIYDFKECNDIREVYNGLYNSVRVLYKSQNDGILSLKSDSNCLGVFSMVRERTGKVVRYYIHDSYTLFENIKINNKYHTMLIRMLHNVCSYYQDIECIEINLNKGTMRVEKSNGKITEAVIENEKVISVRNINNK